MTTQEAAQILGLTVRAVQKMVVEKRLASVKVGRDWFLKTEDVMNMKKDRDLRKQTRRNRGSSKASEALS